MSPTQSVRTVWHAPMRTHPCTCNVFLLWFSTKHTFWQFACRAKSTPLWRAARVNPSLKMWRKKQVWGHLLELRGSKNCTALWLKHLEMLTNILSYPSSTARGGGRSFENSKRIGEIGCCESRMTEQKH